MIYETNCKPFGILTNRRNYGINIWKIKERKGTSWQKL